MSRSKKSNGITRRSFLKAAVASGLGIRQAYKQYLSINQQNLSRGMAP